MCDSCHLSRQSHRKCCNVGSAIEIASQLSQLFTLQWRVFTAKSQHSHWVIRCLNNVFNNYCIVYKARLWCDVISMYCVLIQNTFAAVKLSGAIICKCINRKIVWLGNGRPVLAPDLIGRWVRQQRDESPVRSSQRSGPSASMNILFWKISAKASTVSIK